jgi:predicted nicotinamide N-methyase
MSSSVISIQIPENAEPGDTLQFEAHGQMLELVVPVGSVPGDVLELQIGCDDPTTEEQHNESSMAKTTTTHNNVTIIDIGNGTTLEFVSELPDDYNHPTKNDQPTTTSESSAKTNNNNKTNHNKKGEGQHDNNDENLTDGTYALPWQSGIELASHWKDVATILSEMGIRSKRRVLELGSGLGLVGISLAFCNKDVHFHGCSGDEHGHSIITKDATVILTDLPAAIPLLEFNVEQHRPQLLSSSSWNTMHLSTRTLRWTLEREPDHSLDSLFANEPPFDMVVGSDLLYNTEYIPHLLATMKRHLHPSRGMVVLAVRWRKPELERTFFQESGLDWELLPIIPPHGGCSLSWKEFGDPSNDASNKYFHQTQISVYGKPQSLAEITEDIAKDLPTNEFLAWERFFIQIYLGKPKRNHSC